ncbi:MAG: UDP-N-acetylglucosamine 1-carboxyvinyltransferase [Patescibacteria group bacterium]
MSRFVIQGRQQLEGEIEVKGMKNAITPILASTLLISGDCILKNVPRILDVETMIEILKSLGSRIEFLDEHTLKINNKDVNLQKLDKILIKKMRSSVLLIGPLLSRFGKVEIPEPGGCIIGNRPIDTHLNALEKFGVKIEKEGEFYSLKTKGLVGNEIVLQEFSVTATENAIMTAVLAKGKTVIKLAAAEPHVQDLCNFLNKAGAKISGIGTHTLEIIGTKKLKGVEHTIIPDQIETGTLAVIGALNQGKILIKNIAPEHLDIILLKLKQIGVNFELKKNSLLVYHTAKLKAFNLQTLPYPGFPTDLQAPFGLLATQCQGTSLIKDPMYEGRLGYIQELVKMGANAIIADPHRVIITGPTPLYGQEIKTLDLRAGATLIIAGLIAYGETIINDAEIIDRGYEKIDERLAKLGAKIKRLED